MLRRKSRKINSEGWLLGRLGLSSLVRRFFLRWGYWPRSRKLHLFYGGTLQDSRQSPYWTSIALRSGDASIDSCPRSHLTAKTIDVEWPKVPIGAHLESVSFQSVANKSMIASFSVFYLGSCKFFRPFLLLYTTMNLDLSIFISFSTHSYMSHLNGDFVSVLYFISVFWIFSLFWVFSEL